jgi:acyl carrier protein
MSGAGLSRGYLNQPKLTEERFVAHPFAEDSAARLYRTGDLARFLPDGNIEFLGRIDQQVKIRGFRVEPAEIEAALRQYAGVTQAVVLAGEDSQGQTSLTAYLTVAQPFEPSGLRDHLTAQIPEYMVPSKFLVVDRIPLTSNGKVDARALAALGGTPIEDVRALAAPRDRDEEQMAAIWMEVLSRDRIGIHDNFFDLGGHSLLAMQIIARIRTGFGVELPVRSFLLAPTVAQSVAKVHECPRAANDDEELARILQELDGITEEEMQRLLAR